MHLMQTKNSFQSTYPSASISSAQRAFLVVAHWYYPNYSWRKLWQKESNCRRSIIFCQASLPSEKPHFVCTFSLRSLWYSYFSLTLQIASAICSVSFPPVQSKKSKTSSTVVLFSTTAKVYICKHQLFHLLGYGFIELRVLSKQIFQLISYHICGYKGCDVIRCYNAKNSVRSKSPTPMKSNTKSQHTLHKNLLWDANVFQQ